MSTILSSTQNSLVVGLIPKSSTATPQSPTSDNLSSRSTNTSAAAPVTIILNLPDGSIETITENPDGSTSISITPGPETGNINASTPNNTGETSPDAVGSPQSTTITLSDGTKETITQNADGTYTLKFMPPAIKQGLDE